MANVERDLIERIRQLEEQNSALQDKLDMIYAILAPDYDEGDAGGNDGVDEEEAAQEPQGSGLVQIDSVSRKKPQ